MHNAVQLDLVKRLMTDYGLQRHGQWLQYGKCPACHQHELFTHAKHPWIIRCGRKNKCNWESQVKELYPDLFTDFNQRFAATQPYPNATADAYLRYARGFDISQIQGWYQQGQFWHPNANKQTATVRFDIDRKHNIYMERFIEPITITHQQRPPQIRKAHFHGSYRGLCWQPPTMSFNNGDTIWLVEGCLDAIALHLNGQKAVAILSCINYPEKIFSQYSNKHITWVWALDNDPAGREHLKKWVRRARQQGLCVQAAQIPQSSKQTIDWNDCHIRQQLTPAHLDNYRYHGSLAIAENPLAKAFIIWHKKTSTQFCFDFDNRLYWFEVDLNKLTKTLEKSGELDNDTNAPLKLNAIKQASTLTEIANCKPTFLYFQANPLTDESWYYCRIDFPYDSLPVKNTFTGAQVASATEFKKRLLSITPGGLFTGSSHQLNWLVKHHIQQINVVNTIDFIGYSKQYQTYVFNQLAVRHGNIYPLNEEDFFEVDTLAIKSLQQGFQLQIGTYTDYQSEWPQWIIDSFGAKGLVAVSFWLGCLFAEQIRVIHKSFPFLEIVGEPGAGKTTLVEFMWKLLGKADEEGFDPSKATPAAISRKFAQVSNLPIVLLEADREEDTAKYRKFDWDELKTAYNGRASRARGIKNSHNDTYEPPFRGALVITQNAPVNASEAILQRIVQLYFDKSHHSSASRIATDNMNLATVNKLSYFLQHAVTHEKMVMQYVKLNTPQHEARLLALNAIRSVRIAKNHAQIMALSDALIALLKLPSTQQQAIHDCIQQLAIDRQRAICADHPIVQQFWEIYDYLNHDHYRPMLNHSRNDQFIAINLNHFMRIAIENRQQMPLLSELKKHLKSSKIRKFHAIKTVNSAIMLRNHDTQAKTVKCWIFVKENSHD